MGSCSEAPSLNQRYMDPYRFCMREELSTPISDADKRSGAKQRTQCLEHAADLIASAERVLGDDSNYANVAYHLAILALEEVGKAGMLAAREISGPSRDS